MAEAVEELNEAAAELRRVLIVEFAATRLGRFLGWFYEWERIRIGDRLAKVATIMLAYQILVLWPVLVIEAVFGLIGVGK